MDTTKRKKENILSVKSLVFQNLRDLSSLPIEANNPDLVGLHSTLINPFEFVFKANI
jgi:hypothetical protein